MSESSQVLQYEWDVRIFNIEDSRWHALQFTNGSRHLVSRTCPKDENPILNSPQAFIYIIIHASWRPRSIITNQPWIGLKLYRSLDGRILRILKFFQNTCWCVSIDLSPLANTYFLSSQSQKKWETWWRSLKTWDPKVERWTVVVKKANLYYISTTEVCNDVHVNCNILSLARRNQEVRTKRAICGCKSITSYFIIYVDGIYREKYSVPHTQRQYWWRYYRVFRLIFST